MSHRSGPRAAGILVLLLLAIAAPGCGAGGGEDDVAARHRDSADGASFAPRFHEETPRPAAERHPVHRPTAAPEPGTRPPRPPRRERHLDHDPGPGVSARLPAGWHAARRQLVPALARSREVFAAATFVPVAGTGHPCVAEPTASFARMRPGDVLVTVEEEAPSRATLLRYPDYFLPRPARYDLSHTPWLHEQHQGEVPARLPIHFRAAGRFFDANVDVVGAPTPRRLRQVSALLTGLRIERTPREPTSAPPRTIHCGCGQPG